MGLVHAEIELINAGDLEMARRHFLDQDEVKRMFVNMLVDSGAYMMAINESIQQQLDLPFIDTRKSIMADGSIAEHNVVGPIIVKFKNRTATCNALVLQGNSEPLLGAIPTEEMDVIIHPLRQEMMVNPEHPYYAQLSLKGFTKPKY
jgi:clan AA aspartic protease